MTDPVGVVPVIVNTVVVSVVVIFTRCGVGNVATPFVTSDPFSVRVPAPLGVWEVATLFAAVDPTGPATAITGLMLDSSNE
jgi:hypothetical protein